MLFLFDVVISTNCLIVSLLLTDVNGEVFCLVVGEEYKVLGIQNLFYKIREILGYGAVLLLFNLSRLALVSLSDVSFPWWRRKALFVICRSLEE